MPEPKTSAAAPPSIAASASSSRDCVGLPSRMYMYPSGVSAAGPCSNVVERWIGGATAPVAGSGFAARVDGARLELHGGSLSPYGESPGS